jgi:hypothetical protein
MAVVRVVVKLQRPSEDPQYVTFNWNLFKAPLPVMNDELCFGDRLLTVRMRRYNIPTEEQPSPPLVTLHAGLTGRWARDNVTPDQLREILREYPSVEVLG